MFFGSALTNFGVEPFLKDFLRYAPAPGPHTDALTGEPVEATDEDFSGFVFKIQANMDKNHRDRIAFVRICSGKFERGMDAWHVQGGRKIKLATGTAMMADDRAIVDEAYAGDIVGLFDPGIFSIGDTHLRAAPPRAVRGHPHVRAGALRARQPGGHHEAQAVHQGHGGARAGGRHPDLPRARRRHGERHRGRGGRRCSSTCSSSASRASTAWRCGAQPLGYTDIRWIANEPGEVDAAKLNLTRDTLRVEDMRGGKLLLFTSPWNVDWAVEHNPELKLSEFGNVTF